MHRYFAAFGSSITIARNEGKRNRKKEDNIKAQTYYDWPAEDLHELHPGDPVRVKLFSQDKSCIFEARYMCWTDKSLFM